MKVGTLPVGTWFFLNHKWYQVVFTGTNNVKANQIGSPKEYTFSIDTEVKKK